MDDYFRPPFFLNKILPVLFTMKFALPLFITILISVNTYGQSARDAIFFSQFDLGGTARTVGVGGSLGALGGDFAVVSSNPAGLATYRSSELVITPTYYFASTDSRLENNPSLSDDKSKFNFNNIGWVNARDPRGYWRTSNIAVGMNKIANFNNRSAFRGTSIGSITDRYLQLAGGLLIDELDDFEAGPAWEVIAIDNLNYTGDDPIDDGQYTSDYQLAEAPDLFKESSEEISGAINELNFSMAGNLEDKIYLGWGVGIPIVKYERVRDYTENDQDGTIPFFNQLDYQERLDISGAGVNFKFGMIYRANQSMRMGLAIHTPTWYSLEETFTTSIIYDSDELRTSQSPENTFSYSFSSPWRFIGSFGYLVNKSGFLTAEVEYNNYAGSSFGLEEGFDFDQNLLNRDIDDLYDGSLTVRAGGEFAVKKLRLRAGIQAAQNPYRSSDDFQLAYSAGLGLRAGRFLVDLAYKRSMQEINTEPYAVDQFAVATLTKDITVNRLLLTLGVRF